MTGRPPPSSVFRTALLVQPIPENALRLCDQVLISEHFISLASHDIFYREARPPGANFSKCDLLLLHGQSFTSTVWSRSMQVFAACGYRSIAVDLPGSGQTGGRSVADEEKALMLNALMRKLNMDDGAIVVTASQSASYVLPMMAELRAVVAVAVAGSGTYSPEHYQQIRTPVLVLWGDRDTSLGLSAANNLKHLPNSRLIKLPEAGHACYLDNALLFQTYCLNFFDLVRNYAPCRF